MSRVNDEQLEKEASQERAMMAKGYKKCDNCGTMFLPDDPFDFVCQNCLEHSMRE